MREEIHLNWADPYRPDPCFDGQLKQKIDYHYNLEKGGSLSLRQAVCQRWKSKFDLDIEPEEVWITPGSESAIFGILFSDLCKDDEVIVPIPGYPQNWIVPESLQARPVFYELQEEDNYQISETILSSLVSEKTKWILLTQPNNPTTTIFDISSIEAIKHVVEKYDIRVLCDMAFCEFTFGNPFFVPMAYLGKDRCITIESFSKGYGLSGLRIGTMIASKKVIHDLSSTFETLFGSVNALSQKLALEALCHDAYLKTMEESFDKRRKKAFRCLNRIPGVSMRMPESGFLAWIKVGDGRKMAQLLERHGIYVNEGSHYGSNGKEFIRIVLGGLQRG